MKNKYVWIVIKENKKTKDLKICGVYATYREAVRSMEFKTNDEEYTITQVVVE